MGVAKKFHAKLCENFKNLLANRDFYKQYLFDENNFTRERKLPFRKVVLIILQLLKSSLKTELKSFYQTVFKVDEVCNWVSNVALCKARHKIKHQLFIDLYKFFVRWFYHHIGGKRWRHFRLLAVDGSALNLPSSDELLERFGHHHTNSIGTKIPQARTSFLCDVLNHITIDVQIEHFKVSEQSMFEDQLKYIGKGDMLTADANYGYFWILKKVKETKSDFCVRISQSANFVKNFLASGEKDAVLKWEPSASTKKTCEQRGVDSKAFYVRLVRVDLPNGLVEVLAISVLDQTLYSYACIKALYDLRWGAEEEIKKYMQRLIIEFFSSVKTNGVLQDFYANVFMLNMVSILVDPVAEQIYDNSKHLKFRRQVNWTSALGDVRKRFVLLFLRAFDEIDSIIKSIWDSFKKNTLPIKPNRKFPRDKRKKGSRQKAFLQYKPAW